jgi:hypothetical protein
MRRRWCLLAVFAVSVIVACNSADRPTAARPHTAAYYLSANGLSAVTLIGPEPSHYESGMAYLGGTGFAELGSDPDLWRTDSSNDTIPQAGSNVFKGYSTVSVPHRSVVLARMFVPGH